MIKHTIIETITVSVLIFMSSSLECIEGQQASTDKYTILASKIVSNYGPNDTPLFNLANTSIACVCMEPNRCPHKLTDSRGIGLIQERFDQKNSCKKASDYCCPNIHDNITVMKNVSLQKLKMCGMRFQSGSGGNKFVPGETAQNAGYGEFPWTVAILTLKAGRKYFKCGASLIHSRAILTAAHCVFNQTDNLVARLGEYHPLAKDELLTHVDIDVVEVTYHPDFHLREIFNNIAVAFLKDSVNFEPHIQPICLPPQDESVVNDKQCIMTGWGTDLQQITLPFSNILESVRLDIVPREHCEKAYQRSVLGTRFKLHRSFICAGSEGADACLGDGGSPLVCKIPEEKNRYRQVGIVSWGIGCGIYPGVYTNVALYVNWIHEQLKNHDLTYSSTFYVDEEVPFSRTWN